ncbi:MAG: hypothetical protein ACRC4L_03605, partial [Mycoplasma sp.]
MPGNKQKGINVTDPNNYWSKLAIWKKYASYNKQTVKCDACDRNNVHKTVLLENGQHICWYSWIKKGTIYGAVIAKSAHMVDIKKEKAHANKKPKEFKKLTKDEEKLLKAEVEKIDVLAKQDKVNNNVIELDSGVFVEADKETRKDILLVKDSSEDKKKQSKIETQSQSEKIIHTSPTERSSAKLLEESENQFQEITIKPIYRNQSKYNPQITAFGVTESRNKNIAWNIFKYSIAITILVFGIIGLYYSSIWQSSSGQGLLFNLGIIKFDSVKEIHYFAYGFPEKILETSIGSDLKEVISNFNSNIESIMGKSLSYFSDFNNQMMTSMMIFSI